jgi:hypothetical protein
VSTLIVTSVVVVYAIASMAYVASSEQRATRQRHGDREARRRLHRRETAPPAAPPAAPDDVELSLPPTQPILAIPPPRAMPAWLDTEADAGIPEFIRAGPVEYEPTGPWRRIRSSAALLVLLTIVGTLVAVVVGVAAVVTILALKNAAG